MAMDTPTAEKPQTEGGETPTAAPPSEPSPVDPASATAAAPSPEQQPPADAASKAAPSPDAKIKYGFYDMRIKVGDRLQLEPPKQTGVSRAAIAVVGWVENRTLIVTPPATRDGRLSLREGE